MTRFKNIYPSLKRDQSGAALVEFAFVAPVFLLMLMGAMDVGYTMYLRAVASGALEEAARSGALQGATPSQLEADIRDSMFNILPEYAQTNDNVIISTKNYTDFSRIDAAEKIVLDNDSDGVLDTGDCWIDEDLNNQFGNNDGANGIGGADDSVYYNVTIEMESLFPLYRFINGSSLKTFDVQTLVVNQPFAAQGSRPTVCKP